MMGTNIFLDQLEIRRENDRDVFENAFIDLCSIIDPGLDRAESITDIKNAVGEIMAYYGYEAPDIPEGEMDPGRQLIYMLRPSGAMKRRVELTGAWWKDAQGCMLGSLSGGDVIALIPSPLGGYTYKDKNGASVKVTKQTARDIKSDAFCFYRPLPPKKLGIPDLLKFILKSVSVSDAVYVLAASLVIALVGMLTPFVNKLIYQNIVPSGVKSDIFPIAALLAGACAGTVFFGIVKDMLISRLEYKIELSVENAAMMRVFLLPADFFKDYSSGDLAARAMTINSLCSMLMNTALTTGLTAVFSFVYLFQMQLYAPSLVIPGLLITAASIALTIATTLVQLKVSRKLMPASSKLQGLLFALVSGIQKIKLAGAEKRAFAKWAASYKEIGKLQYSPPFLLRIGGAVSLLVSLGGSLLLYYIAGITRVAVADYLAFNAAYGAVSAAFMALGGIAVTIAGIKPTLDMVAPILNAVPEHCGNKKIVENLSGNIELSNVTFRYDKGSPAVIDDLSLKIKSGDYVAIVGQTGCGKSTLLRLLLGFEKPERGAVYYDSHDVESMDMTSARQCIGVDLQNGKLFSGDIFSNIVIAAPWKTLDDAWEAAKLAGLDGDIRAMPMGMHTMISEGGGGISGGQRQRILIARAIIGKPKILFFDEATSALDNITQKHVADSIATLRCTRVVIAHRLSTIKHCDRIIVMEGGKIAEDGDYKSLMEKRGTFYELVKKQTL